MLINKMDKSMLTQKQVERLFDYNSDTGILTHKTSRGGVRIGAKVGCSDKDGYLLVGINDSSYFVHRVIWLWYYGYLPEGLVDHIDQIPYHNWIDNLRESSHQCNSRNTGNPITNTSGVKGVMWINSRSKWIVRISLNNKNRHIGYFSNFDEAVYHRLAAEQCLDWTNCDSNSPAYRYIKEVLNG